MTSVLFGERERVVPQVKTLLGHNHSRPWFVVSCGCRVLPDNAHQQTSIPPVGSSTGDFERRLKRALEVELLSPCGKSPLRGPWKIGRATLS